MNSEKVKEIKKGLECCSTLMDNNATSEEQDNSCNECPYRLNDRCSWKLDGDALTLINELESENERLLGVAKEKIHDIGEMGYSNAIEIKQLKDRIAELKKKNKDYYDRLNNLQTYIDNHEEIWKGNTNNTLKQFGKKFELNIGKYLKKKYNDYQQDSFHYIIDKADVDICLDETLKELNTEL